MPTLDRNKLIQLVHIAKTKLRLSDIEYRSLLAGATEKDSCADMTLIELEQVLRVMKQLGFKYRVGKRNPVKPDEVVGNASQLSARQVYYIKGLFDLACRATDESALRKLIKRQTGVEDLRFVPRFRARSLILMLKDIAQKAGFDPEGPRGAA